MPFDGVNRLDCAFTPHYAYHPFAPLTGQALARSLRTLYACARTSSRIMFQQPYTWNFRDIRSMRDQPDLATGATFVRLAEGYRWLPPDVTHIVADVIVQLTGGTDAIFYARCKLDNNAGSLDTGPTGSVQSAGLSEFRPARASYVPYGSGGATAFSSLSPERPDVLTLRCEVARSTVATQQDVSAYVEVYALDATAGTERAFRPLSVSCWWECRG
jgi:hypothetical protein